MGLLPVAESERKQSYRSVVQFMNIRLGYITLGVNEKGSFMPSESASATSSPWYLLWVLGALALAAVNAAEFLSARNPGSAVLAFAWCLWAFSWYAKPFHIRMRASFSEAVSSRPIRPWVPKSLWNFITIGALALLVVGLAVKFLNAA